MDNDGKELAHLKASASMLEDDYRRQQKSVGAIPVPAARQEVSEQVDKMLADEAAAEAELKLVKSARAAQLVSQQQPVTLLATHARSMSEYFSRFGSGVAEPRNVTLPAAFALQFLGSISNTPGVQRPVPQSSEHEALLRARAHAQIVAATRSVSQQHLISQAQCIDALRETNFWRTPPAETLNCTKLRDQMMTPVIGMETCIRGDQCVARVQLRPHKNGLRMPLKRMQKGTAFSAFIKTGQWLKDGEMAKCTQMCVPCILLSYAVVARSMQEAGEPCANRVFPFSVTTGRAGGFAPTHLINDPSMPVAWPQLSAQDFEPEERTFRYTTIDPHTRAAVEHSETVFGYTFRSEVLFVDESYSIGEERFAQIPMRRPLTTTTKEVSNPDLPHILTSDVHSQLAADISTIPGLEIMLQILLTEFDQCMRACTSADKDTAGMYRQRFTPCWQQALNAVPDHILPRLGDTGKWDVGTHSILASSLWRVGLCYILQDRGMEGNTNLSNFLNAHTAINIWLFDRWVELGAPPSDHDLMAKHLAVVNPVDVCAQLVVLGLYPEYPDPYLSPSHQRQVVVKQNQRRRTPAMEIVRTATLPDNLIVSDGRPSAGVCLQMLRESWKYDTAIVSGGWLLPVVQDSPLASLNISLLRSSPSPLKQWIAEAISMVALQTNFEDSIWLLGCILERWPWFQRAAAAYTSSASLTESGMTDQNAASAVDEGRWVPGLLSPETDMEIARPSALPSNPPAWVKCLKGYRRFGVTYKEGAADVVVGAYLYPDALLNQHGPGVHSQRYLVLAALRLRVFELQRIALEHDKVLGAAMEKRLGARQRDAKRASESRSHPNKTTVAGLYFAMSRAETDTSTGKDKSDSEPGVYGENAWKKLAEKPANQMPLPANCTITQVTEKLVTRWPNVSATVEEALAGNTVLCDNACEETLGPLWKEEMPALFDKHGPACLGPPESCPSREIGYQTRCALFEGLELAHHARNAEDASDEYWFAALDDNAVMRNLDYYAPLANATFCEDTLPDLTQYIGLGMLHEPDFPSFTADTRNRRAWPSQVATLLHKACYIRDFGKSHAKNCRHPDYVTWAAQALMTTALGTYRHSTRTLPFARAVELYQHLRLQNQETTEGRKALASFLVHNTYQVLIAGREFHMVTVAGSCVETRVMRAAWPSFRYVQECWIPQQAERLRCVLSQKTALPAKERYARELVRDEEKVRTALPAPRVLRHLPNTWSSTMLNLMIRAEIDRQTNTSISTVDEAVFLPKIVNSIPSDTKHLIASYFSRTDPHEPIKLQWFRDCGLTDLGVAQLACCNFLYLTQGQTDLCRYIIDRMNRADFMMSWIILHIMTLYRDTQVLPVPWSLAERQYRAAQYRFNDMKMPPPQSVTHAMFCHLLGCSGPQSYTVPLSDALHYGANEEAHALDIGRPTCSRHKSEDMFHRLVRRTSESPMQAIAAQLLALRAALDDTSDPDERSDIETDIDKLCERLTALQSKDLRATAAVMMTRPCNEAPARRLRIVGALITQRNSAHQRTTARVYTACPLCAMPTQYSIDRYGPNGFTCGKCNHEERWAAHGRWCISCGTVEQAEELPELAGEAQAAARLARTQHQIRGSTSQPRSLRSAVARHRHEDRLRRQTLADEANVAAAEGKHADGERDISDTLVAPRPTKRQPGKGKRSRRVNKRRGNMADTYQLGRSLTAVHRSDVKLRMERFAACPVIDDRPGGMNTTALVSFCRPCLTKVRTPTVWLSNMLLQSQAEPDEIWIHGRRISLSGKPVRRYYVRRRLPEKRTHKKRALITKCDASELPAAQEK